MLGRIVSHYRILNQLGSGGMGVVYAAEDIRLGRSVALKFVSEDLARDQQTLDRLRREARAASALSHANICTIYDIDDDDERPFIVMELLKGQTLRDALARGPLTIRQIVDVAIQVSDALDAVHAQGILHRDIKPANLFLTERNQVKILDFGLAKQLPQHVDSATTAGTPVDHLTTAGVAIGTVAYMSPEQVMGDLLDGRTDLFSLGIVLYECVTGRRPFAGKTSAVVFSTILNETPTAPGLINPKIPPRLQEVIQTCLEKDRELRYQDAAGLRADLRRVKRDLDTGSSGAFRTAVPREEDAAPMNTSSAAGLPSEEAQQRHSTQIPGATGSRTLGVSAVLAAATLLVLAAGAYLLWGRTGPSSAADPSGAASVNDALIAQKDRPSEPPATNVNNNVARIDSANANLEARNYRAALADAEAVLQTAPGDARASRVREVARETLARFDDGIARAGAALAAGNLDAAEQALAAARAIDPSAPAVADLTAQLLARLKSRGNSDIQTGASAPPARPGPAVAAPRRPEATDQRAARPNSRGKPDGALLPPPPAAAESTQAALPPRPSTPPPPGASPNGGVSSNPAPSSPPPAAAGAPPVAATPTTSPPTSSVGQGQPAAASQAPGPKTDAAAQKVDAPVAAKAEPPAAKVEPPPAPASAAAPPTAAARRETDPNERGAAPAPKGNGREGTTQDTEDDDAAIRRVINTYARAIETKNLALFRSVKPNLSAEEQRRIEESFRNVSSQRIAVTILSVTRQAREASVRLRRRDEIEAGGRRQVNESQQTVILDRVGSSWVIREIGR